jgi:TolB-like protein
MVCAHRLTVARPHTLRTCSDEEGRRMRFMFGQCALDSNRRELIRGPDVIATRPQVFDLLVCLLENHDRVVSKDDLLDAVWRGRIVSESTLASHINAVRKAIGDSGKEQQLIKTIFRKGFRFGGEVRQGGSPNEFNSLKIGLADPGKTRAQPLVLPDRPSIAVLPFMNLSGAPKQDYFADGVVEDIIVALSRIRWLFVIARNSSFAYKGKVADVKQVGRDLGVRYVLEGSLRRAAKRVRITGQLVDATTGGSLGRSVRGHSRRHLRVAGSGDRERHRRAGASTGTRGDRTRETEVDRKSRRLRLLLAWHGEPASRHKGFNRGSVGRVLSCAGARPEFRVSLCDDGVVLFLAQDRGRGPLGPPSSRVGRERCSRTRSM